MTNYSKAQEFTSSGTFNVPANVHSVKVTLIGGGGGGAGTYQSSPGPGGDGGATGELIVGFRVKVTPSSSVTVTIGAGGAKSTVWPDDLQGTPGGNTSFGDVVALGARRDSITGGIGGGMYGADSAAATDSQGDYGDLETPLHFGGSGGPSGGSTTSGGQNGQLGGWSQGYAGGGAGGAANGGYGGGGGGTATPWGIGGEGGRGNGLGGSAHDGTGDTGGNPASTNGIAAPTTSYGAGGGGAGGCYASYNAKLIWSGAGAPGYCLVEWVE